MAEDAKAALYKAVRRRMVAANVPKIYLGQAPAKETRPYYVFAILSGGEANLIKAKDAEYTLMIKCVSDKIDEALAGSALIAEWFNDSGILDADNANGQWDGGDVWDILTVTQGLIVSVIENVQGATQIYHEGHQFRVRMEGV
jgi:hypothetical protein